MDRPVIIIEAPELDTQSVVNLLDFHHKLLLAMESHYYPQLQQHQASLPLVIKFEPLDEDKDPF